MYKDYFGLKEEPFSIAPDPQFMYMSERHREALAHLLYGLQTSGGFVLLTGEVGTGKTTVCRCLLEQVPEGSEIAFVLNPKLNVVELLATICDELRISYPPQNRSIKLFIDAINSFLLCAHSRGRKTVLIIDEAQNLRVDVLDQIRLLTNLETHKQKLLQVIMLGQPELKVALERPELRQLAQRITARYHLEPLAKNEIQAYINHRLAVAGVERPLFPAAIIGKLYQLSGGVPRLINLLCDRALLGAYVKEQHTVSPALLNTAAAEVFGPPTKAQRSPSPFWQWALLLLVVVIGSLFLFDTYLEKQHSAPAAAVARFPIQRVAPVEILAWDDREPLTQSAPLAYQALFNAWGVTFDPAQGTIRAQAKQQRLELLNNRGSLGRLRQLNRPAVLTLTDARGQEFFATLIGLNHEVATLVIGRQVHHVSIASLNKQWLGEYLLLWQPPAQYQGGVKPGDQGAIVAWLEEQMAKLNGRAARSGGEPILDGMLLEELQQFQSAQGLEPDGIVGTYTLILINSQTGDQQPTLTRRQKG
jgi:general secretion pathway protein A